MVGFERENRLIINMSFKEFVGEFLSFLEFQEARLLSWGFYDFSYTKSDVEELFDNFADKDLKKAWGKLEADGKTMPRACEKLLRKSRTSRLKKPRTAFNCSTTLRGQQEITCATNGARYSKKESKLTTNSLKHPAAQICAEVLLWQKNSNVCAVKPTFYLKPKMPLSKLRAI